MQVNFHLKIIAADLLPQIEKVYCWGGISTYDRQGMSPIVMHLWLSRFEMDDF